MWMVGGDTGDRATARVDTRWPGHAAMGRRGPLASGPYHLKLFPKF
jgi:hypothetical protein